MNIKEYDTLKGIWVGKYMLDFDDLIDQKPRTLLYGYDTDRNSWHVYIRDGQIHRLIFKPEGHHQQKQLILHDVKRMWGMSDLVPNKRLYPQYCDFEVCRILQAAHQHLPFTIWEEPKCGGSDIYHAWAPAYPG